MSAQPGTCNCAEVPKTVSPGGATDASETSATRAGVAEYSTRASVTCNVTFSSYAERYRYLRGKAACSNGTIPFPCCSATNLACNSC